MRRTLFLITLTLAFADAAQVLPLRITAFDTHSGILVTQFRFLRVRDDHHASFSGNTVVISSAGTATSACISFMNTLPRDVTQVDFHFVYYDRLRNHAGEADLIRTGTFAPNVAIDANFANRNYLEDTKDCVLLPAHDPPLALAVVFVKSATFADGSQWATSGPAIAAHLGPPRAAATP
jgi:hypothetical protein